MEYTLEKLSNGMHYIMLDKKAVTTLTKNGNKRVICKLNNQLEIHSALLPKKEGGCFITIGLTTCKKLKIKEGSIVTATFQIDKSDYQFEMPAEFKEVLNTDSKANKIFHALTPGNQRGIIYLVGLVKSSDKRIERSLKIAEKLKAGVTSPPLLLK
jgi:hypothetical protein